jgi:hypothetical protein
MKKIALFLLAALTAQTICACASGSSDDTSTAASVAPDSTEVPKEVDYYRNLPAEELDYDGRTFRIVTSWNISKSWNPYLTAEDETGEVLNDAAYQRNLEVAEKLNITIESTVLGLNVISSSALAGDDAMDLICYFQTDNVTNHLSDGILFDWNDIPHINQDEDWYNQSARQIFNLNGKQLLIASRMTFPVQKYNPCLFNKNLMDELGLEYPYEAVMERRWTFDMMKKYIKDSYHDVDGSGTAGMEDRYGLGTNPVYTALMSYAANEPPTLVQNGSIQVNLYNERITSLVEELVALHDSQDVYDAGTTNDHYTLFQNGNALFCLYGSDPANLRSWEVEFGYLPYPMFDDTQKDYSTFTSGGLMGIPVTAQDTNFIGVVVEALSAASEKYTKDAFVEMYFNNKVLRDEESIAMYEIMSDTSIYEISRQIDPSGLITGFMFYRYFLNERATNVASYSASIKDQVQRGYDEFLAEMTGK